MLKLSIPLILLSLIVTNSPAAAANASVDFKKEAEKIVTEEVNLLIDYCNESFNSEDDDKYKCFVNQLIQLNILHEEIILKQEQQLQLMDSI